MTSTHTVVMPLLNIFVESMKTLSRMKNQKGYKFVTGCYVTNPQHKYWTMCGLANGRTGQHCPDWYDVRLSESKCSRFTYIAVKSHPKDKTVCMRQCSGLVRKIHWQYRASPTAGHTWYGCSPGGCHRASLHHSSPQCIGPHAFNTSLVIVNRQLPLAR